MKVDKNSTPAKVEDNRYDFKKLTASYPPLKKFVSLNKYGNESINFFDPEGVRALNHAILTADYGIEYWQFPKESLTPPIPGREQYIDAVNAILSETEPKKSTDIKILDVGVGTSLIYPIIGASKYGWNFVGSDTSKVAVDSSKLIAAKNPKLSEKVEIRMQRNSSSVFEGIIEESEFFDVTICNPPFHDSKKSAQSGSMRKLKNLKGAKPSKLELNFKGEDNELWCEGGEVAFIKKMIKESSKFGKKVGFFSSLVSKEESLKPIVAAILRSGAKSHKVINLTIGNKESRIVFWSFNKI